LGESLRPGGGVSDAAIGIGASGFVDDEEAEDDDDADEESLLVALAAGVVRASGTGCGGLASEPGAAWAAAGRAQTSAQARISAGRRTTAG
jgi:hypothetical protein